MYASPQTARGSAGFQWNRHRVAIAMSFANLNVARINERPLTKAAP